MSIKFQGDEFFKYKTKATDAKLRSLGRNMTRLVRKNPPLRGFATKWSKNPERANDFYKKALELLFSFIQNSPDLTAEQRDHFLTGETFQSDQKGPTAPVELEQLREKVIDPIKYPTDIRISDEDFSILQEVAKSFLEFLKPYVSLDIRDINFAEAGAELPNQTVRGYPFHSLGEDVDDLIVSQGGSDCQSALSYFKRTTQLVCFPGGRIQGKPFPGPAKTRIVMIPSVYYQYMIVGIVSNLMSQLKLAECFIGGRDPITRSETISKLVLQAEKDDIVIIQLDFSAFDKDIHIKIRKLIGDIGCSLMKECPEVDEFKESLFSYLTNQGIFLGNLDDISQGAQPYLLPNQLPSGIKDTQLTGSGINGLIQGFALRDAFDDNILGKYVFFLGDDAGIPVKRSVLTEYGYQGTLEKISNSLKKLGFTVNPTKAYPNEDFAFLQKLYVPRINIKGAGTWARSMASFLYKEKYTEKIPGIKNLAALEIISQISILNEVYSFSGVDLREFSSVFADLGLEEDDGLRFLIQSYFNGGGQSAHMFFKFLIDATGLDIDSILKYNDSLSYDHTDLSSKLQSKDYGETFKILNYLLKSKVNQKPIRSKVRELFNEADFVVDADLNPDDIDTD